MAKWGGVSWNRATPSHHPCSFSNFQPEKSPAVLGGPLGGPPMTMGTPKWPLQVYSYLHLLHPTFGQRVHWPLRGGALKDDVIDATVVTPRRNGRRVVSFQNGRTANHPKFDHLNDFFAENYSFRIPKCEYVVAFFPAPSMKLWYRVAEDLQMFVLDQFESLGFV